MSETSGRRERLWRRNPRCFWCGVVTTPCQGEGRALPTDATLEHLNSRNFGDRPDNGTDHPQTVLACSRCNAMRQKWELERADIEAVWAKSKSRPATAEKLAQVIKKYAHDNRRLIKGMKHLRWMMATGRVGRDEAIERIGDLVKRSPHEQQDSTASEERDADPQPEASDLQQEGVASARAASCET